MSFNPKISLIYQNSGVLLGLLSISIFLSTFISCQRTPLQFIERRNSNNAKEVQLGESQYYLEIPDNFELSEARGKEGGLGYNIVPRDSASKMFGFVEIEPAGGIGDDSEVDSTRIFVQSYLSGKKVKWKIYQTYKGYFEAYSSHNGNLSAYAISNKRSDIDTLVSIIATLMRK